MTDALTPRADREAIARVIDPEAFRTFSTGVSVVPKWRKVDALAAADRVLALGVLHPSREEAADGLGKWMSAALDDPNVCDAMKADIVAWFEAGEPSPSREEEQGGPPVWAEIERIIGRVWNDQMSLDEARSALTALRAIPAMTGAEHKAADPRNREEASAPSQPNGWRPTHRHVKRGTTYATVNMSVQLQTDKPLEDYAILTVYQDEHGNWWARPTAEFTDPDRFEPLPPPPSQESEG